MNTNLTELETLVNNLHINNSINLICKLQSIIRMYLVRRKLLIPNALYQTKNWRKQRSWYKTGKSNECELYQIKQIESITNTKLLKTLDRIHMNKLIITSQKNPLKSNDGFEYSETFDGIQKNDLNILYFNLKFVCDSGGAQTRTLREVYHFIESQLKLSSKIGSNNMKFINILDGDTCHRSMDKFNYLLNRTEYIYVKKYVFIGDMHSFQNLYIDNRL